MTSKKLWVLPGAAIALAFALALPARAALVTFTVDTTGTGTGLTNIANTSGNVGKYAAGSWLTLSGKVAAVASGISASGNFGAQKAASGAWSTGNPGSLVGFYSGSLVADINVKAGTISFTGGSAVTANNYTGTYPIKGGSAQLLAPAIGGGTTTTPGSDPANYGVTLKITALGGLVTAANGNAALRQTTVDIAQIVPGSAQALSGSLSTGATFTTNGTVGLDITNGNLDYNLTGNSSLGIPGLVGTTGIGSTTNTPMSGAAGTLVGTLIDPVRQIYNFTIVVPTTVTTTQNITGSTPLTATITTIGQVVGFANNVQVPEPATLALAAFAVAPLGLLAWRRRRKQA